MSTYDSWRLLINQPLATVLALLIFVSAAMGTQHAVDHDATPAVVSLSNVLIAEVEVEKTSLKYAYAEGSDEGQYVSTMKVISVAAGDPAQRGREFTTRPYSTASRAGGQVFQWAVSPAFKPGERLVIPLVSLDGNLAWMWWDDVWADRPPVARSGTASHLDDLQLMNDIAVVLQSEPQVQWKMLRDYGAGANNALAIWATAVLITELEAQQPSAGRPPDSREVALETLKAMVEEQAGGSFAVLTLVAQGLPRVANAESIWQSALMKLATRTYENETEATSAIEILRLSTQARVSESAKRESLEAYVQSLRNPSIPSALRLRYIGGLTQHLRSLTDVSGVVTLLLVLTLEGDTGEVRLAAAEGLRDLPLLGRLDIQAVTIARNDVEDESVRQVLDSILQSHTEGH